MTYGLYRSPFGDCLITITEKSICGLYFFETNDLAIAADFLRTEWGKNTELHHTPEAIQNLGDRLFSRNATSDPHNFNIYLKGTDFQLRVWQALLNIPYGQTSTYQNLAATIGQPKAMRAVGNAVGRNPVSYVVPCHRILRTSGEIGGYRWGVERKIAMLDWEKKYAQQFSSRMIDWAV
ncbi:methylated-DNA--[protein]-cysteine S-methyltransferase [[Limnothrix rosea] IAM M-220]|uniref:methylated-DNA--[protein]-cysteine S-methyltransferase n=1 Tax=[Limnothrix rosea] IAM M-220 TaxID=454133 RepID=UPI001CECE537|nr:methylated-DNA--[protein]-cysteine S-methyltransferase [[Limnothrix rosea] IAM M-220]